MKNKKLIARIFAVVFSLVLVVALALPCFAEETDQPPTDYVYKRVYSLQEISAFFNGETSDFSCIVKESIDLDNYCFGTGQIYFDDHISAYVLSTAFVGNMVEYQFYIGSSLEMDVTYYNADGSTVTNTFDITWEDIELYVLVPSRAEDIIEEQGWYGQIKNIIKDAVFGSDTVLNDSQEFTINQISLWLSLIAILLPLIVVAIIVVRCFR